MASVLTCLVTSAAWCCCTATASLMGSCCGNDKPSNVPPSSTSGRKRSVLLLLMTIAISFAFQYGVGPWVMDISIKGVSFNNNYVTNAWTDGCLGLTDETLQEKCVGNSGVYRATSSAFVFFVLAAVAAYCKPTANREAWPAKYALYLLLVLATCFIPNDPLFSSIYLQAARIGAIIFVLLEQIIILDLAFNWNDSWVEKSNKADTDAQSNRWLGAILASCFLLFSVSLTGIGLLYAYFGGCTTHLVLITLTLVLNIAVTVLQLSGSDEGSLLSSAVISSYGTYLAYTAVTKNPDESCNPTVGQENVLGIVLGVGITLVSLAWMGYSFTAEKRINGGAENDLQEDLVQKKENPEEDRKVQGVVTNQQDYGATNEDAEDAKETSEEDVPPSRSVSWKLNVILAMISCFIAMTLTGWGSIQSGGNAANPDTSKVSMWMIIASQWIVFALYAWSLSAPRLFPDRDFS